MTTILNAATLPANTAPEISFDRPIAARENTWPMLQVWIVDDNEFIRSHMASLLRQQGGIACDRQFTTPVSLLSALTKEPGPDAILLDVQMGAHNGLDAVQPIKTLSPFTRVYMFSTCFDTHWRYRAFSAGATDYLLKSYAISKIADRLRNPVKPPDTFWQSRVPASTSAEAVIWTKPSKFRHRILEGLRGFWNLKN